MSILVIAEHDNKNLKGATLNTLNAATQMGDEIHLLVAGHEANNVVEESQSLNGVTKIISVDNELYKNSLAEEVENLSHQYINALRLGKPKILSSLQMKAVLSKAKNYKRE